jgi:hypothetical protein
VAITAHNPGRTRLAVTLAGLAIAALGGILWLVGEDNNVKAANRIDMNSGAAWGEVLGYNDDRGPALAAAEADKSSAETQMTFGIVLAVAGLLTAGSRWLIQPAAASSTVPAAVKLTPEQEEQAIAMYLEARKRADTER